MSRFAVDGIGFSPENKKLRETKADDLRYAGGELRLVAEGLDIGTPINIMVEGAVINAFMKFYNNGVITTPVPTTNFPIPDYDPSKYVFLYQEGNIPLIQGTDFNISTEGLVTLNFSSIMNEKFYYSLFGASFNYYDLTGRPKIINDLITGGVADILSAEQGKVLNATKADTLLYSNGQLQLRGGGSDLGDPINLTINGDLNAFVKYKNNGSFKANNAEKTFTVPGWTNQDYIFLYGENNRYLVRDTDYSIDTNGRVTLVASAPIGTTFNWEIFGLTFDYFDLANRPPIINNLTDGGSTKILSAEQGKVLYELFNSGTAAMSLVSEDVIKYYTLYGSPLPENATINDAFNNVYSNYEGRRGFLLNGDWRYNGLGENLYAGNKDCYDYWSIENGVVVRNDGGWLNFKKQDPSLSAKLIQILDKTLLVGRTVFVSADTIDGGKGQFEFTFPTSEDEEIVSTASNLYNDNLAFSIDSVTEGEEIRWRFVLEIASTAITSFEANIYHSKIERGSVTPYRKNYYIDGNDIVVPDVFKKFSSKKLTEILYSLSDGSSIADGSIDNDKLADDAVDNDKIIDNTIENSKLLDKTITSAKIEDKGIEIESLSDEVTDGLYYVGDEDGEETFYLTTSKTLVITPITDSVSFPIISTPTEFLGEYVDAGNIIKATSTHGVRCKFTGMIPNSDVDVVIEYKFGNTILSSKTVNVKSDSAGIGYIATHLTRNLIKDITTGSPAEQFKLSFRTISEAAQIFLSISTESQASVSKNKDVINSDQVFFLDKDNNLENQKSFNEKQEAINLAQTKTNEAQATINENFNFIAQASALPIILNRGGTPSFDHGTVTQKVQFAEIIDVNGFVNDNRFTVTDPKIKQVLIKSTFILSRVTFGQVEGYIYKNGANIRTATSFYTTRNDSVTTAVYSDNLLLNVSVGDYFEFFAQTEYDSGSAQSEAKCSAEIYIVKYEDA